MSWIQHLGQPLASSIREAEEWISCELQNAVPKGWQVLHSGEAKLTWSIRKETPAMPEEEYGVRVPSSLDMVLFLHGNSDVGPLSLGQCLQPALVIEAAALRHFGMRACLDWLFSRCQPNTWGLS